MLLALFSLSTAIDVSAFALEPYHIAHGRAGRIFRIRMIGALVYLALLAALLPRLGAPGAAWAGIGASAVMFVQLVASTMHIIRASRKA